MSRISDSIYYTLLSDGCSREEAAQSAKIFHSSPLLNRFDFYPAISSSRESPAFQMFSCGMVKGNPGHPGSYAVLSAR